ncbi:MAG: GNAT family N-acetyltransferase [Lachnospiraceae bacterium]|nr:GNAT family N-acetyltransferase [Lachnospiraceae bacterium]
MEIKMLDKETYAGRRFTARYKTKGYYDIHAVDPGFQIEYVAFEAPVEKSFDDVFFSEWLENPVAYGAFQDERLLGYAEGFLEQWNNRFRISNICIFDHSARHHGIGTLLMATILKAAKVSGARMIVLETQSCNENAISFYRKNGFEMIGFDLYSYSNTDPEQHEIRIEMGKKLV